jgi:hypothetical protein
LASSKTVVVEPDNIERYKLIYNPDARHISNYSNETHRTGKTMWAATITNAWKRAFEANHHQPRGLFAAAI